MKVPNTEAALPRCKAIEVCWIMCDLTWGSLVVVLILLLKALKNLKASGQKTPAISMATGIT